MLLKQLLSSPQSRKMHGILCKTLNTVWTIIAKKIGDRSPVSDNYWKLFVPHSSGEHDIIHSIFTHMELTVPMNYNSQNIDYILFARAVVVHVVDHYLRLLQTSQGGFPTNFKVFITFT